MLITLRAERVIGCEKSLFCSEICKQEYLCSEVMRVARVQVKVQICITHFLTLPSKLTRLHYSNTLTCLQIFEQNRDCSKLKRVKDFSVACMAGIGKV